MILKNKLSLNIFPIQKFHNTNHKASSHIINIDIFDKPLLKDAFN